MNFLITSSSSITVTCVSFQRLNKPRIKLKQHNNSNRVERKCERTFELKSTESDSLVNLSKDCFSCLEAEE